MRAFVERSEAAAARPDIVELCAKLSTCVLADSTQTVYAAGGQKRYFEFCLESGVTEPFPVVEPTMVLFVVWLTTLFTKRRTRLKPATLAQYVSHVYELHLSLGFSENFKEFFVLRRIMKAIKRSRGVGKKRERARITLEFLRGLRRILDLETFDGALIWCAVLTAFFKLLRAGELAAPAEDYRGPSLLRLCNAHLAEWKQHTFLVIRLVVSKTDPFRVGRTIVTPSRDDELCPVWAFSNWLKHRSMLDPTFKLEPLFVWETGCALTYDKLNQIVKEIARVLGMENWNSFSGHSFRKGGATALFNAGMSYDYIRERGNWLSNSFEAYLHKCPFSEALHILSIK